MRRANDDRTHYHQYEARGLRRDSNRREALESTGLRVRWRARRRAMRPIGRPVRSAIDWDQLDSDHTPAAVRAFARADDLFLPLTNGTPQSAVGRIPTGLPSGRESEPTGATTRCEGAPRRSSVADDYTRLYRRIAALRRARRRRPLLRAAQSSATSHNDRPHGRAKSGRDAGCE